MKIAMVTEYLAQKGKPRYGGVDARTLNLAKNLAKNSDVHIITSMLDGTEKLEEFDGVVIHRIGKKRKFTQRGDFLNRLNFSSETFKEISRLRPDIVDASGFVSYAGTYKGAKRIEIPSVVTVHEVWQGEWFRNMGLINSFAGHFLEKHYLRYPFNTYIAVSNFTKDKLVSRMKIPDKKIKVVYNGIDKELFDSVELNEKFRDPTLITVCRSVRYKRVDDLLRAVDLLKSGIPKIKLKIVGTGPEEQYLRELSKRLNIEDNVEFMGKISDDRCLIEIMKKSHVFCLSSLAEGFGMVVIEAMACGIPYVASDITPIREVTHDGMGGFLFAPKDYKDLALKIGTALEENVTETNYYKIKEYIKRFDWKEKATEIKEIYVDLVNQGEVS